MFVRQHGGPVAQRLEQGTHNPLVPGSNPGGPSSTNQLLGTIVESNRDERGNFFGTAIRRQVGYTASKAPAPC